LRAAGPTFGRGGQSARQRGISADRAGRNWTLRTQIGSDGGRAASWRANAVSARAQQERHRPDRSASARCVW